MKRHITIILSVACIFLISSCKNTKSFVQVPEEIQDQVIALADSILLQLDAKAETFQQASQNFIIIPELQPSEVEKKVKIDYLLDPSLADTFVTKSQKIKALAIYVLEKAVREIYDMPTDEVKEVILKLAVDIDYNVNEDTFNGDEPLIDKIKREYDYCRENGKLNDFWLFQDAILCEFDYLLANNTELFFREIDEEKFYAWRTEWKSLYEALSILSEYDSQIADLYAIYTDEYESYKQCFETIESTKAFYQEHKNYFIEERQELLK